MKTRSTAGNDWIQYYLMASAHQKLVFSNHFQMKLLDKFVTKKVDRSEYFGGLKAKNLERYDKLIRQTK